MFTVQKQMKETEFKTVFMSNQLNPCTRLIYVDVKDFICVEPIYTIDSSKFSELF